MSASNPPASKPLVNDIPALKDSLYAACVSQDSTKTFYQTDLVAFNIIKDVNVLAKVIQALIDDKLFKICYDASGRVTWRLRSVDEAKKYLNLTEEQSMVFSLIDDAGDEGIWSKTIKAKTNLHDAVFRTAIKHLEAKGMISDMKTVEHPTRKMYIKSSIRPSERATGGSWYTDSELDEEFIDQLMDVLYKHIKAKSFYRSSAGGNGSASSREKKPKKTKKLTAEEARALRDKSLEKEKIKVEDEEYEERAVKRRRYDSLFPMPPGYQDYPTLQELTLFIENSNITTTTLTSSDIQQLLDILCYDNRIERVLAGPEGVAYKALRKGFMEEEGGPTNGLTEAPCGRCPVFDLCEEGGPVGPSNCQYFTEWLSL